MNKRRKWNNIIFKSDKCIIHIIYIQFRCTWMYVICMYSVFEETSLNYIVYALTFDVTYLGKGKSVECNRTSSELGFFCISSCTHCNCKRVLFCPSVRSWIDIGVATDLTFSIQARTSSPSTWMSCRVPCFRTLSNICPLCSVLPLDNERNTVMKNYINIRFNFWCNIVDRAN